MNRLRGWLNTQPDWMPPFFFAAVLYGLVLVAVLAVGVFFGAWVWMLCWLAAGALFVLLTGFAVLFMEWLLS